jgi:hypothetical protein
MAPLDPERRYTESRNIVRCGVVTQDPLSS